MPVFKDRNGREWLVRLDVAKIREVRERYQVNLAAIDGSAYDRLEGDPELLVNVLWTLCKSQGPEHQVTEAQFGESLVGDAIDDATAVMLKSISDFFPKSKREMIQTLAAKNQAIRDLAMAKAMAKLSDPVLETRMMEAMDRKLEADVQKILTQFDSATDSPESSESIPTP